MDCTPGETAFPTLATERLRLREIVDEDAPALFAIHGDEHLMRWFGRDPLADLESTRGMIRDFQNMRREPAGGVRWAIERKADMRLIGTCGFFSWNRQWHRCLVGYELAADTHGQGYMREALVTVIDWGFANLRLNRIEAMIHPDNHASAKVVRHFGFVEEGRLRQVGYWNGRHHDMNLFALLREQWEIRSVLEQSAASSA